MHKVRCTSSPLDLICHFSEVYDFDVNCNDCWKQFNRFIGLDCRYVVKIHASSVDRWWTLSPLSRESRWSLALALEFASGVPHGSPSVSPRTHFKRTCAINLQLWLVVCRYLKPSCHSRKLTAAISQVIRHSGACFTHYISGRDGEY